MPNEDGAWIVGTGPYFGYDLFGNAEYFSVDVLFSFDPFKSGGKNNNGIAKHFDFGTNI